MCCRNLLLGEGYKAPVRSAPGYFVTSRLVLTARHVITGILSNVWPPKIPPEAHAEELLQTLAEKDTICRVRALKPGGGNFLDAVPSGGPLMTMSLSWLAHPLSNLGSSASQITWANVPESESINVKAVGFPEAITIMALASLIT